MRAVSINTYAENFVGVVLVLSAARAGIFFREGKLPFLFPPVIVIFLIEKIT